MEKDTNLQETFHRIFIWNHVIMNYGGYVFMKKSNPYRKSFIVTSTLISLHDLTFLLMSIYTIVLTSFDKDIAIQLALNLMLSLCATVTNIILSSVYSKFHEGEEMLRRGVYTYGTKDIGENDIKKRTVRRLRFLFGIFEKSTWFTILVIVLVIPVLRKLFSPVVKRSESLVNPYLSQPIYIPFRTDSWYGFLGALIFIGLSTTTVLLTAIYHINMILSSTLQLCGQFEVLTFSVENIAKRAQLKLIKANLKYHSVENSYLIEEFHRCLYSCLRENILHHQCILR